jgi:peroxiredoxin
MELHQPAPDFELADLDGKLHHLSDSLGRIVIVNFWSAECPVAEQVDRELLGYLKSWGEGVVLLTVAANANESEDLLTAAARSRGLPLVLRCRREILDAYNAQTTPHLFVVDTEGILRYRGAFDDITFRQRIARKFYLKDAIEAILSGSLPDPAETAPYGCVITRFVLE